MEQPEARCRQARRPDAVARLAFVLALTGIPFLQVPAAAETTVLANKPAATAKAQASRPTWKELSEPQRQALQPLAAHWDSMPSDGKRKWLALSHNYYNLSPDEQAKLQSRMREWGQLSQQQRSQARLNYAETKKLAPEQKSAQWQAYQQLSPEEKRKLAAKAPAKRPGVAAVKLDTPNKVAPLAPKRASRQESSAGRQAASPIDRDTLLPRRPEPVDRPEQIGHIERPERPERPAVPGRGY